MKKRYCASCRNGEIKNEADYMVKGKVWGTDRMVPYRAYICKEHMEMLFDDGAELEIIEYISQRAKDDRAWELIEYYTAYENMKQFLAQHAPTLMDFPGAAWLRRYFKERTGRKAYC